MPRRTPTRRRPPLTTCLPENARVHCGLVRVEVQPSMGSHGTEGTGVWPPGGRVTMSAVGGTVAAGSEVAAKMIERG